MKVTPEDLYSWVSYAYDKLTTNDGKISVKNAFKGCGYIIDN